MSPEEPVEGAVPSDRWPWPLCTVEIGGETPRICSATEEFEASFGSIDDGTALSEVLSAAGFEGAGWASDPTELQPGASLRLDRTVATSGDSNGPPDGSASYVLQVLPHPDPGCRFLSMTPLSEIASEPSRGDVDRTNAGAGDTRADAAPARIDVEDVASVLSHDLRNPLDVAKARLRAGRETGDDEHLAHVARAHDRMERLLEDVLTLARTDALDPAEDVALRAVAERAWSTVETDDASLEIALGDPSITADEDRLRRLFENCFRNAIEHGAPDDASITVTVGRLEGDEQRGFYVADDGRGLPNDERERVFEPGFSEAETSTGLGLAIVERIAARHGWTAVATDAADGGARFEFRGVQLRAKD